MKVEIKEDIGFKDKVLFRKGLNVDFQDKVNLVVGLNGSGKTTFLRCIRQFEDKVNWNIESKELRQSTSLDKEYKVFSHFAREDDSSGMAVVDMDLFLSLDGLNRMKKSSGESNLIAICNLIEKARKYDGGKPVLILLDEVAHSFDYKMQHHMSQILKQMGEVGTVIYVTHNIFLMNAQSHLYLIENKEVKRTKTVIAKAKMLTSKHN